jgi:hypothetical protein
MYQFIVPTLFIIAIYAYHSHKDAPKNRRKGSRLSNGKKISGKNFGD